MLFQLFLLRFFCFCNSKAFLKKTKNKNKATTTTTCYGIICLEHQCCAGCHDTNRTGNTGSIYFSLDHTGTGQVEGGCTWTITVEEGYTILLVFENLQLQKSQGCGAEYFKVYDGHTVTDSSLLET